MPLTCLNCNHQTLESIAGTFETGVVAPDGYRETVYEEGYQCSRCGRCFDELDVERKEGDDHPCPN